LTGAPATPRATSTRGVYFGVSSKNSRKAVLAAGRALHHILDRRPPNFAARVVTIGETTWFAFIGTRGRNYELEPWVESLMEDLKGPLVVVLREGDYLFAQRYTTPGSAEPIEVDDAHLATRDVDPWLLVEGGKRVSRRTTPAETSSLVGLCSTAGATQGTEIRGASKAKTIHAPAPAAKKSAAKKPAKRSE
jgi:hypothetical protein